MLLSLHLVQLNMDVVNLDSVYVEKHQYASAVFPSSFLESTLRTHVGPERALRVSAVPKTSHEHATSIVLVRAVGSVDNAPETQPCSTCIEAATSSFSVSVLEFSRPTSKKPYSSL